MSKETVVSEYQEDIEIFKKERIQQINEEVIEYGYIEPTVHLLCKSPDESKLSIALIPIPGPLLNTEQGKDILSRQIIPQIIKKLAEEKILPVCLSFATEGWCWESIEKKGAKIDYQKIKETSEKKKVVILSFENELLCTGKIFYKRGTKINNKGEVEEGAYLEEKKEDSGDFIGMQGRFTEMFRKPINFN